MKSFGHRFGGAPSSVYNKMNQQGVMADWMKEDYATILSPLYDNGWRWDSATERLVVPGDEHFLMFDTPWCHAKGTPHKHCSLDHMIIFNVYGIIPKRCQHCWKVVAAPNTVSQLVQLEQLELKMNVPCKCGIELRDYTPRHYGGYFYNNSFEEGREKHSMVRNAIDKYIDDGKDINVILKRGCTEFELIKGPSPFWHTTKEEERVVDILEAYIDMPRANKPQSELVKKTVRMKWMFWAFANGDKTYKEFNNNQDLYTPPVVYHEGDINGIKADIASGRAAALAGVPAEASMEFLKTAQDFAEASGINLNRLKIALGDEVEGSPLRNIPEENKGGHDQLT